jgi:phosphohistidine phosphatase
MRAYLVQHGKSKSAQEDPNNGLSDDGREEVQRVAEFLKGLRITMSLIQHSGKLRSEETAHILASCIPCTAGPNHTTGLNPLDDPQETADFLDMYTDDILIVGHLPHLERLTSLLLTGSQDRPPVIFRNAGVVCLEKGRNNTWSLVWAIVPDLLKKPVTLAA